MDWPQFQEMKKSTKAALLSGLVFPGFGHLFLRRYAVGVVLLFVAGASVFTIAKTAIDTALEVAAEIESGRVAIDSASIGQLVAQRSRQAEQSTNAAVWLLLATWIIGIIDSYRVGRAQEVPVEASVAKRE